MVVKRIKFDFAQRNGRPCGSGSGSGSGSGGSGDDDDGVSIWFSFGRAEKELDSCDARKGGRSGNVRRGSDEMGGIQKERERDTHTHIKRKSKRGEGEERES